VATACSQIMEHFGYLVRWRNEVNRAHLLCWWQGCLAMEWSGWQRCKAMWCVNSISIEAIYCSRGAWHEGFS
jgi:hypothetical protein